MEKQRGAAQIQTWISSHKHKSTRCDGLRMRSSRNYSTRTSTRLRKPKSSTTRRRPRRRRRRSTTTTDFELVGVQTPAERAAESRRRAEAEGNVLEIDDDDDEPPRPRPRRDRPLPRRSADRRGASTHGAAAPQPTPRRGTSRVRCRRVYFGTALRRDVTVVTRRPASRWSGGARLASTSRPGSHRPT